MSASDPSNMKPELSETLSSQEAQEFAKLDSVIKAGAETFMAVGTALVAMHAGRLYREKFATFQAYTESRGIKRQAAYSLMEAVQLTLELEVCRNSDTPRALANIEVLKNSSANAIKKLKGAPKEKRAVVLDVAVVESAGRKLTGAAIEKATAEVTHRASPPRPVWFDTALLAAQHGGCPPEQQKPAMTLNRWVNELALMENEVNQVCAGNQKEREKFGAIANALANRLMNPPRASGIYTR